MDAARVILPADQREAGFRSRMVRTTESRSRNHHYSWGTHCTLRRRRNFLMSTDADLLAEFSVILTLPVQWGDQDAMQHVNNVVYFRWCESARIEYFGRIGLADRRSAEHVGPILASIKCDFRRQLNFPDTIRIGADRAHRPHQPDDDASRRKPGASGDRGRGRVDTGRLRLRLRKTAPRARRFAHRDRGGGGAHVRTRAVGEEVNSATPFSMPPSSPLPS